jgi:hypothetical protein
MLYASRITRDWRLQDHCPMNPPAELGTLRRLDDYGRLEWQVVERERKISAGRVCPWCESEDVRFVQRGYVGPTDEVDQYLVCGACHKKTYEIVAKTAREMRLGRYKPGDVYQDRPQNTRYTINRVLRAGQNEFLLYLKPLAERAGAIL